MKIRNNYVSNSSSSSFVILDSLKEFFNEKEKKEEMEENIVMINKKRIKENVFKWYVINNPTDINVIKCLNKNISFEDVYNHLKDKNMLLSEILFNDNSKEYSSFDYVVDKILFEMKNMGYDLNFLKNVCEQNAKMKTISEMINIYKELIKNES